MAIYRVEVTYNCLPIIVETRDGLEADTGLLGELDAWVHRHRGRWNFVTAIQEGDAEEQHCDHLLATADEGGEWKLEVM